MLVEVEPASQDCPYDDEAEEDRALAPLAEQLRGVVVKDAVVVHVAGDRDLDLEVYGARDKGDLFRRAFGVPVEILP